MIQNEFREAENHLQRRLSDIDQDLKSSRQSLEDYQQLSKESKSLLQETAELFYSSSDAHIFRGILEEQTHLDKKMFALFEEEQDELIRQKNKLLQEQEALQLQYDKEDT